jgi:hypothetical protein
MVMEGKASNRDKAPKHQNRNDNTRTAPVKYSIKRSEQQWNERERDFSQRMSKEGERGNPNSATRGGFIIPDQHKAAREGARSRALLAVRPESPAKDA